MFPPAQLLDPLRIVQGTRNNRYDCPDVAVLDRHINHLRRRIKSLGNQAPDTADHYRADIDRLLDRRFWLTLPVAERAADDERDRLASVSRCAREMSRRPSWSQRTWPSSCTKDVDPARADRGTPT
jgi:phage terminase Nu1 subunit (DNA packaging protein)